MSNCLIIIDNGHGVQTKGKSVITKQGFVFHEWIFTRIMKMHLIQELTTRNISYFDLVNSVNDVPLWERKLLEHSIKAEKAMHISIHADAFTDERANGITVFSSMKENLSDTYADVMVRCLQPLPFFDRYDINLETNELGRDANFFVNREFKSYGILIELGFATNDNDLKLITNYSMQKEIAKKMADACEIYQNI